MSLFLRFVSLAAFLLSPRTFSISGRFRAMGRSREVAGNARAGPMRIFEHLRLFLFDAFGKKGLRKRKQI